MGPVKKKMFKLSKYTIKVINNVSFIKINLRQIHSKVDSSHSVSG